MLDNKCFTIINGKRLSMCTCKSQSASERQRQLNNSEYRTLQVEDKIYILFDNKENIEIKFDN